MMLVILSVICRDGQLKQCNMEAEQGPDVSAPETTDLKVPDKTPVRKHIPGDRWSDHSVRY